MMEKINHVLMMIALFMAGVAWTNFSGQLSQKDSQIMQLKAEISGAGKACDLRIDSIKEGMIYGKSSR